MNRERRPTTKIGVDQIVFLLWVIDALQFNNLIFVVYSRDFFTCRFRELETIRTQRISGVFTAICIQRFIDPELGVRQKLLLREIWRSARNREVTAS